MSLLYAAQLLYFFLPAYVANMMPVLGKKWIPALNKPVHREQFGSHKTWQGLVLGTLGGVLVAGIQYELQPFLPWLSIAPYARWIELGFLLGAGAMAGDLVKSFFKRQAGIPPGKPWIPFDQLDFVIGALLLSSIVYFPGWFGAGIIAVVSFVMHVTVNHIGHAIGLRKVKW